MTKCAVLRTGSSTTARHTAAGLPQTGSRPRTPTGPWSTCPCTRSWLNQSEIYFSIPTRKALTDESFDDLDALVDRIH